MKILFSILLLLATLNILDAQNNGLVIRTNQLFTNDAKEEVFPDSPLIIVPTELDDYSHFGIDISYFKKMRNLKWIVRIGYDEVSSKGTLVLARSFGYANSKEDRIRRTVKLGSGFYYPTALGDDKLDLNFTLIGVVEYKYEHRTNFKTDAFGEQDDYLQGYERNIEYPGSWKIRLESGLAFYYYFVRNFGIGGELSPYLYFERFKGSRLDSFQFFGDNRTNIESDFSEHREKRNNFGLSIDYAFGIVYNF